MLYTLWAWVDDRIMYRAAISANPLWEHLSNVWWRLGEFLFKELRDEENNDNA